MSVLTSFLRCFCLCIVIERGSWYPNQRTSNEKRNHRAILKNSLKNIKDQDAATAKKPEWLKEWTISKGWVHNKSHLLQLGKEESTENLVFIQETHAIMEEKNIERLSDTSSVQLENIDDLISIDSNINNSQESRNSQLDFDRIDAISNSDSESDSHSESIDTTEKTRDQNIASIFDQVSENYRQHFPEKYDKCHSNELSLPEVYKEHLLINKSRDTNVLLQLWKYLKPKRKQKSSYNCKFTVNQLYDSSENMRFRSTPEGNFDSLKSVKRNSLGRNIAIYNTLNSRTNLHEDPIYECSEENSNYNSLNNIYFNPVYVPSFPSKRYYDFPSNHRYMCNNFAFTRRDKISSQNRLLRKSEKKDSFRAKLKTEKYVIRHIRIRIMLSMRVGKVQKVYRSPRHNLKRSVLSARSHESDRRYIMPNDRMQFKIARIHEEQKRIGNGKTSIKIQNMRY